MFRFEKLEVWSESINYAKKIYKLADTLPRSELFGLNSQLKRAALSIPSNIAEGSGGSTTKDFSHYLDISIKSTIETVSQLFFGREMGYFKQEDIKKLYEEAETLVKRIQSLKKYLHKSERRKE
ncbi:MAG: four helix bundle protein [Patescibacteria group bacterium]|nr:four helix bundle protein [Patescibacteria group bacterium]